MRYAGGKLLKNNKPSQLDPLPVIMAVGEADSQQRIRETRVLYQNEISTI